MEKNRLLELDALRGIAALVVVIYHYFFRYNSIYGHHELPVNWSYIGQYGVQLFFMVSGFVIYWTLNRLKKPSDFIVSRFSRLYPAYWFSAIVTLSLVSIFGLAGREVSSYDAIMNVLMFHEYLGVRHIDGVYWTLTVELTFYFWIFVFFYFGQLKYAEHIFAAFLVISLVQKMCGIDLSGFLVRLFMTEHILYFLAGICFYKVSTGTAKLSTYCILLFTLLSASYLYSTKVFILTCLFYVVFYLATKGRFTLLLFKPFVFLGGISYSLYLLHQNIGYLIINKLYDYGLAPLLSISTALLVAIALAYCVTEYIEKPSLVFIRKLYKKT